MSQVSTTTSTYLLVKFARQEVNPHAPEQGLTWSFFDKPVLTVKLLRTTSSHGPYHEALARLGAARIGQPNPSSLRLEVEWQVENVGGGSSQTQSAESPYTSLCLQSLDFDAQARLPPGGSSRSELPLKATFQDDMVGFRFLDTSLQSGTPYRRFQLKFPSKADMFRFLGEIENVCPCAEATVAPVQPAAVSTTASTSGGPVQPVSAPQDAPAAGAPLQARVEATKGLELSGKEDQPHHQQAPAEVVGPPASPPQPATTDAQTEGAVAPTTTEALAVIASSTECIADTAPKKGKGKKKAPEPALVDEGTEGAGNPTTAPAPTKKPKAPPKPKAKPRNRYTEAETQTSPRREVDNAVGQELTESRSPQDPSRALPTGTVPTTPQVPTPARLLASEETLPSIEEAEERLSRLAPDELAAALVELVQGPRRDVFMERLSETLRLK